VEEETKIETKKERKKEGMKERKKEQNYMQYSSSSSSGFSLERVNCYLTYFMILVGWYEEG